MVLEQWGFGYFGEAFTGAVKDCVEDSGGGGGGMGGKGGKEGKGMEGKGMG